MSNRKEIYKMKNRFTPKVKIKKGDQVSIIAGDDKDLSKSHTVLAVYPKDAKVLVEGVNMITKHMKPSAQNPQGGIVKQEAPIHISNVQLWDSSAKSSTRVRIERKDGKAIRISKKSGKEIK